MGGKYNENIFYCVVKNNSLFVDFKLQYQGKIFNLKTSGKVYPSNNLYTGGYLIELEDMDSKAKLKEKVAKINKMESWFWPYLDTDKDMSITNSKAQKISEKKVLKDEEEDYIPAMHDLYFTLNGEYLNQYGIDAGGFYKNTVTWPVGSENHLTNAFQWAWVHNGPEKFESGDESQLSNSSLMLTHQGQFIYIGEKRELAQLSDSVDYRIKNPSIKVGLYDGNSEIISMVRKEAEFTERNLKANLKSLAGLFPFADSGFIRIISSLDFIKEENNANSIYYSDNVEGQELIWGNTIRGYNYKLEDEFFIDIGDRINLSFLIQIPTDNHIERLAGKKEVQYLFEFDIYEKNAWGFYTEKIKSVDRTFSDYYEVLE